MFLPRKFAIDDLAALDALLARDAFVTLVSQVDGVPFATHLPVLYDRQGNRVRFTGHWARANRQWQGIAEQTALLIVHGAHAYVSPTWYADPAASVPTWNYVVAHITGRITLIEDTVVLQRLVADLAERYESAISSNWRFPDAAPGTTRELAGIVGFELLADDIQIKHKLNQHHADASVEGAVRGLRGTGRSLDGEIAAMMEASLNQRRNARHA